MNPENHQNPESRDPKRAGELLPGSFQEIVELQQQAIDSSRVWGSGDTLIDAINNLEIAKDEAKREGANKVFSDEIIRAAELRVTAARKEVFQESPKP